MKGVRCIFVLLMALVLSFGVDAQSVRNSIRSDVMLDSLGTRKLSTVRYFDGLGRPEQEVAVGVSPSGADIVRHSSRDRAVYAVYYDNHGNVVQTHAQNALGGYDRHYWRLTFTGRPLSVRHEHTTADTSIVSVYSYAYDHAERLLSVSLSLNDAEPFTLFTNSYNELGQLQQQAFGAESAASVEYGYNVRGWTQNINTQCFSQTLYYETASNGVTPCYNGNISAAEWTDNEGGNPQQYAFSYDGLNRLVGAEYSGGSPADSDYSCQYAYDLNGNMTWLRRKGKADVLTNFGQFGQFGQQTVYFGDIDELTMDYSGNRLRSVSDAADALTYAGAMDFRDGADSYTEYTYDANGNMTSDANKGITAITYNVLNLPEAVTFADGHQTRYTYAADGRKLRTEYCLVSTGIIGGGADRLEEADPFVGSIFSPFALTRPSINTIGTFRPPSIGCLTLTARSYCGPHVYLNGRHERMLTDCGYIQDGQPHYYVKDYQGNVRAVLNSAGTVVETNSYYPYGALMATTATESAQPYKYGTKELDRENGLNLYDSQARHYDPILARTTTYFAGLYFPTQTVMQSTTSVLFHEIGERNTLDIYFRGVVIDIENYARRAIGLPVRPYDLNHSKTIKTNYTE